MRMNYVIKWKLGLRLPICNFNSAKKREVEVTTLFTDAQTTDGIDRQRAKVKTSRRNVLIEMIGS